MYKVVYHSLVIRDDFKHLSHDACKRILKEIERKLFTHPDLFGKPLKRELKGYFKLRVGEYRIVYYIDKGSVTVFILSVGFRRDFEVYVQAAKRLRFIS